MCQVYRPLQREMFAVGGDDNLKPPLGLGKETNAKVIPSPASRTSVEDERHRSLCSRQDFREVFAEGKSFIRDIWSRMRDTQLAMGKALNPTTQAVRTYLLEFGLSMTDYVVVLCASIFLFTRVNGVWRIVIALLPIIPVGLVFAAAVWFLLRTDELERQIAGISLALAGGATALLSVTYGFLEVFRFLPPPSAWLTWTTFMLAWFIASFFVRRWFR